MDWLLRFLNCGLAMDPAAADRLAQAAHGWASRRMEAPATAGPFRLSFYGGRSEDQAQRRNGRAVIPLTGTLVDRGAWWDETSYETFSLGFLSALDDESVAEILLYVNSPGGMCSGCPETADLIYRARGRKPITAIAVSGMCCSAAYWVASAADKLYATRGAMVGSIGVIMIHSDYSRMQDKVGITTTILRRPEQKGIGNPYEPLSEDQVKTLYRTSIDPTYRQFIESVAKSRNVSAETVVEQFGRGLAIMPQDALRVGMIDGIVDWTDYFATNSSAGQDGRNLTTEVFSMKYSLKLKALLFGLGLLPAADASDDLTAVALGAYFAARNAAVPETEDTMIAGLRQSPAAVAGLAAVVPQSPPPAAPPPAAPDAAALQQAVAAERQRVAGLRQRAQLLGVDDADASLQAAIDNGTPVASFVQATVDAAVAANRPLTARPGTITPGPAQYDTFARAAVDALILRSQSHIMAQGQAHNRGAAGRQAADDAIRSMVSENQAVRDIMGMSWQEIMRQAVGAAGVTPRDRSPLGLASAFLGLTGQSWHCFAHGNPRILGSDLMGGGYQVGQGPGDYPAIMDGVAAKIVNVAARIAPVTYDKWCRRLTDMENFQPKELVALGYFGELPLHIDGKEYEQHEPLPTEAGWIAVDEYGMEFALTPRMVLQDPTDILVSRLTDMQVSHEKTLNRLCVDIIKGDVASPVDGVALFSHTNAITSGGDGPDIAQTQAMRRLMNQQKILNDTEEAGIDLAYVLVPSEWLTDAQVVYSAISGVTVVYNDLDKVNPFGGLVPLYEPMLSLVSGSNSKIWYGAADPMVFPGIYFAFLTGYGPGGRRDTYYDPRTEAQVFRIKGAFGAALRHHAAFVRNKGAA
jgi:signal peptide peptidase SppA